MHIGQDRDAQIVFHLVKDAQALGDAKPSETVH